MSGALHQLFTVRLVCSPDRPWLVFESREYSYAKVAEQVRLLTVQLRDAGIEPGSRVAIYMAKSPGYVAALLACSQMGLVAVPIHMVLKAPQLNYILINCSASALIIDQRREEYVASVLNAGSLSHLVSYRDDEFKLQSLELAEEAQALPERFSEAELLIYTSGSTGRPKGVVVSRSNLALGAQSVSDYLGLQADDRILALMPFAFDYGFNQLSSSLRSGATLVLMDFLLASDVVRQVKQHDITVIAGVPPLWAKLLDAEWGEVAASLRLLTNTGGRLPAAMQDALVRCFKNAELVLMYGLTEAFRSTYLPPTLRAAHPDSIGQAIPGAELYVINKEGGEASAGEHGELVHCGPLVTLGYWGEESLSESRYRSPPKAAQLESESGRAVWSGDLVYRDEEGLLYFVGREDGLLKSSGYRISAEEVEEVAYTLEGIKEAVVVGVEDPSLGQRLVLIASRSSSDLDEESICQHMRTILPEYMVPHEVAFWPELPHTPSGKFDRVAIKAQLK